MKSVNPSIEIVAVEPGVFRGAVGRKSGTARTAGNWCGFVPDVLNTSVYDRISKVKEQEEAYKASRLLAEKEGVLVGISSSSTVSCTLEAGKEETAERQL